GGGIRAFLYDGTNPMRNLGTLPGTTESVASGINARGQVVGNSDNIFSNVFRAFLYDGTAMVRMRDLPTLGGTSNSATGINASGQVVAYSYISGDARSHAFFHNGTAMLDLGTLSPDGSFAESFGYGINARRHVVGYSGANNNTIYHGFLY